MRNLLIVILFLSFCTCIQAQETNETEEENIGFIGRLIEKYNEIDSAYVEPPHYNFSTQITMTYTYDIYQLKSSTGQKLTLAPSPTVKVGPYFGWRWIFLGYTFDLKNIGFNLGDLKQEIDLSIYSSKIGIDLYYRRTGSNYKIRDLNLWENYEDQKHNPMEGMSFDGLSVGITGFNIYYIFNNKRFSYPAAFSQSTQQKISSGSWLAGIGYTRNSLEFDHQKLQRMVEEYSTMSSTKLDSGLMFNSVKYYDYCLTGGYAYNWVFARNWLFSASASLGLAYKHTVGDVEQDRGFRINNLNFDGIGRFALVFNNLRWYAGASAILHGYTYRKSRFSANNVFGSLNAYVGYNFGLRKQYRKKK